MGDRQGWDEVLILVLRHLTEKDVVNLCQLTPTDVRQDTTRDGESNTGSAILPYLENMERELTGLSPTLRQLVEGCRRGWARILPADEGEHVGDGGQEQSSPGAQNLLDALREATRENRRTKGSQNRMQEGVREWGSVLGGWQAWQADLREVMQQHPLGNRAGRERRATGGPATSQGPPAESPPPREWPPEREAQARDEEPPGHGRDPRPCSLPLTRIEQDVDPGNRETPCSMDLVEWGSHEEGGGPPGGPGVASRQQEGCPSSNPDPGAGNRQAIGGGTPATHHREELALLGATRRQAVRFLGRCRAGPPHW